MTPSPVFLVCSFLVFMCSLVVEMDLPWDDSQVDTYGDSFKAWGEAEFEAAIHAIKDVLSLNWLTWSFMFSLTSLGVSQRRAAPIRPGDSRQRLPVCD
jgi:hypothetical protein